MLASFNKAILFFVTIFLLVTVLDINAHAQTSVSKLLKREVTELKKELHSINSELSLLKQTHQALLRKNSGEINTFLSEENSNFRSRIAALESDNVRLKSALSQEKKESEDALNQVQLLDKYRQGYEVLKKRITESNYSCDSSASMDLKDAKNHEQESLRKLEDMQAKFSHTSVLYSKKEKDYEVLERLHKQLADSNKSKKSEIAELKRKLIKSTNINTENNARYVRISKTEFNRLKKASDELSSELNALQKTNEDLESKLAFSQENLALKKSEYEGVISQVERQKGEILSYEKKVEEQQNIISDLESQLSGENDSQVLIKQLKAQVADLQQRYTEANNLVMLKDTEIRMMRTHSPNKHTRLQHSSAMSENKWKNRVLSGARNPGDEKRYTQRRPQNVREMAQHTPGPASYAKEPMSVRVIGEKVNLRVRPGKKHSPVQQVAKGTELIVESEVGEWFQIITPTGQRAYVHSTVVEIINSKQQKSSQIMSLHSSGEERKNIKPHNQVRYGSGKSKKADEEAQAIQLLKDAMRRR